jgi:hypothetical protein
MTALGYQVRLADTDVSNRTLSRMTSEAEKIAVTDFDQLAQFISGGPASGADVSLIDVAGGTAEVLADFFTPHRFRTFQKLGVRIVAASTVTQTLDSVRAALDWIKAFKKGATCIVFANERDTPAGQPFSLEGIRNGDKILAIAGGRVIHIQRWSELMARQYNQAKGMPSDYMLGGRVCKELKLNRLFAARWQRHHRKVTASVASVSEWLTGKPPPKPAPEIKEDTISPEKAKLLAELKADLAHTRSRVSLARELESKAATELEKA